MSLPERQPQQLGIIDRALSLIGRGKKEQIPEVIRKPNTAEQFVEMARSRGLTVAAIELGVIVPDEEHPFPRATLSIRDGSGVRINPDNRALDKTFAGVSHIRERALLSALEARGIIRTAGIEVHIFEVTDELGRDLEYDGRIELSDEVVDQRAAEYKTAGISGFPISMPNKLSATQFPS